MCVRACVRVCLSGFFSPSFLLYVSATNPSPSVEWSRMNTKTTVPGAILLLVKKKERARERERERERERDKIRIKGKSDQGKFCGSCLLVRWAHAVEFEADCR